MKDRRLIFLAVSVILHFLVFISFFKYIPLLSERNDIDTMFDSLYTAFMDETHIDADSMENYSGSFDSIYLAKGEIHPDSLSSLQSELQRYYQENLSGVSLKRLSQLMSGTTSDSLLAMSEALRKAALKRLFIQMARESGKMPDIDIGMFSKRLQSMLLETITNSRSMSDKEKDLLELLANDEELLRLWEQMLMKSLMDIGLEKLRQAMGDAIGDALQGTCTGKSGEHKGTGHGKGGLFSGGESDLEIIRKIRNRLMALDGSLISMMGSLMGADKLEQFLKSEMLSHMQTGAETDPQLLSKVSMFDFAGLINEATRNFQRSSAQINQFYETFEDGLGKEITEMFGRDGIFDEEGNLAENRIHEYADNYIHSLQMMVIPPNLLRPDLEEYAKSALGMRNRKLKEKNAVYEFGGGIIARNDSASYVIPEIVFINDKMPKDQKIPADSGFTAPTFFTHAWGAAVRSERRVKIDGILDEWANVQRYRLAGTRQGILPLPPELQSCNFLLVQWDNQGLYFAYEINDTRDNSCNPDVFWDTDALELFIDPLNLKDSVRATGRSYQFWVWPRVKRSWGFAGESVFLNPDMFEPRLLKTDGIQVGSQRSGNRYTCEVRVDPSLMKHCVLLPGNIIGFNYSIDNGDDVYIRWVTNKGKNESGHPVIWGDLLLMGSDSRITSNPEEFILPGQSLEITIVDHDMNISSQKPDKVVVKLRSKRTGDFLPCICMETGINTGIFTSRVGTIFGIKSEEKRKLSVLPGDLIEVYYLDQHASGGRKSIPVRRYIQVARGVFTLNTGD